MRLTYRHGTGWVVLGVQVRADRFASGKPGIQPAITETAEVMQLIVPQTNQRGAGEGNRTLVVSLGSFCSTIELHPRSARILRHSFDVLYPGSDYRVVICSSESWSSQPTIQFATSYGDGFSITDRTNSFAACRL